MPDTEEGKFFAVAADLSGVTRFEPAAWLRVSGEDAASFLQGQFTQELRPERAPPAAYALLLTAKGKVVADAWVLREADGSFRLASVGTPAAVLKARLEAYIIADDVVIEDETAAVEAWLLAGAVGRAVLAEAGLAVPAAGQVTVGPAGWVWPVDQGVDEAWQWVRPRGAASDPGETLPNEVWERARVAGGIPRVPEEVGAEDLPAEAGLDRVAIAYDKGCYLGQEVMARLRAKGRVRRRLVRVRGEGATPAAGERRLLGVDGGEMGEVRGAVGTESGWIGLAMVKLGAWAATPAGAARLERAMDNVVGFHPADLPAGREEGA
jgi:tRNA-modifying protein YgfZ